MMTSEEIKAIALECGFNLKVQTDGGLDLNPYVYVFAEKLISHKNKMLNDEVKDIGDKLMRNTNLINQQASMLADRRGRIDKALEIITEYYTGSYEESPDLVVDIEQALKGDAK